MYSRVIRQVWLLRQVWLREANPYPGCKWVRMLSPHDVTPSRSVVETAKITVMIDGANPDFRACHRKRGSMTTVDANLHKIALWSTVFDWAFLGILIECCSNVPSPHVDSIELVNCWQKLTCCNHRFRNIW